MGVLQSLSSPIAYHRLMKSPLDDSEIFTSVTDLMSYCSSGAWYEGQKVSVTLTNGSQFHYQIRNGVPIIIPSKGWEPVWVSVSDYTASTSSGGTNAMLIYHWNDPNQTKVTAKESTTVASIKCSLYKDPDAFSLFDTVGVFKTNSNFYFMTVVTDRTTGTTTTYLHSQAYDPVEEYGSIGTISTSSALTNPTTLKKVNNSNYKIQNASAYIRILPVNTASYTKKYIVKIYAISDTYYNAWGGGNISG